MIRLVGIDRPPDQAIHDLSFATASSWSGPGGIPNAAAAFVGDPVTGPMIVMSSSPPPSEEELAAEPQLSPPHGHRSDSFRFTIRGSYIVGQSTYPPGTFRFQAAGQYYGRDGLVPGSDGGWGVVMMGDRRGWHQRPTRDRDRPAVDANHGLLGGWVGDAIPTLLPEADWGAELAGMATTFGAPSKVGNVDGSFAQVEAWQRVGTGSRLAVAVLGEKSTGPVVLLTTSGAGQLAAPACTFGADSARFTTGGSCQIGDVHHVAGDIRIQADGVPWDRVVAGPEGLDDVFVIADRRHAVPTVDDANEFGSAWRQAVESSLAELAPHPHYSLNARGA
jgi:hypothetical protein